jgi:tetratricopeptide (TPR) repeat protein
MGLIMVEDMLTPDEIVRRYLRAQNLEQVGRIDEAVEIYEEAIEAGFDAAGPYDRLIAIYSGREQHTDVSRVAAAAITYVRTYDDKKAWYEARLQAAGSAGDKRGAEF